MQFLFVEELEELDIDLKRRKYKIRQLLEFSLWGPYKVSCKLFFASSHSQGPLALTASLISNKFIMDYVKFQSLRVVHHMHLCGHAQSWTVILRKLQISFELYMWNHILWILLYLVSFCLMLLFWNSCYCMSCSLFILILRYFLMWTYYMYFLASSTSLISSWLKLSSFPSK